MVEIRRHLVGATDSVSSFIYREYRERSNVGYGTMLALAYLVMVVVFGLAAEIRQPLSCATSTAAVGSRRGDHDDAGRDPARHGRITSRVFISSVLPVVYLRCSRSTGR